MTLLSLSSCCAALLQLAACLALFGGAGFLSAWNKEVHEAIAQTAISGLQRKAGEQAKRLLGNRTIVEAANWGHIVESRYPETTPYHYQYQNAVASETETSTDPSASSSYLALTTMKISMCTKFTRENCEGNFCLLEALEYIFLKLTAPKADVEGDPQHLVHKFKFPSNLNLSDGNLLNYLITLLADLHQPLRIATAHNFAPSAIQCTYDTMQKSNIVTNLFKYWDEDLVDKITVERENFWYSGWTHAGRHRKLFETEEELFREYGEKQFALWAKQSFDIACNSIYPNVMLGQNQNSFPISNSLHDNWSHIVFDQIIIAGIRIAVVLNYILEKKHASILKAAATVAGVEERTNKEHAKPQWVHHFLLNLLIFLVILLLFVAFIKCTDRSSVSYSPKFSTSDLQLSQHNVVKAFN